MSLSFTGPGSAGRNNFHTYWNLIQSNPKQALDSNITISSGRSIDDFFGFAAEDIKMFDKDSNGKLDVLEIATLYSGSTNPTSEQLFQGLIEAGKTVSKLDQNMDGYVDTAENAARLFIQDAPGEFLIKLAEEYYQKGLLTPEEAAQWEDFRQMAKHIDTKADGVITPEERALANQILEDMPIFSKKIIGETLKNGDFRNKYDDFLKRSGLPTSSQSGAMDPLDLLTEEMAKLLGIDPSTLNSSGQITPAPQSGVSNDQWNQTLRETAELLGIDPSIVDTPGAAASGSTPTPSTTPAPALPSAAGNLDRKVLLQLLTALESITALLKSIISGQPPKKEAPTNPAFRFQTV